MIGCYLEKKAFCKRILHLLLLISSFGSTLHTNSSGILPEKPIIANKSSLKDANHALYIGVIQITMEETMTIQVKVFSDDLQAILQNEIGYQKIGAIKELCETQPKNLQQYFQRTLQVAINELPIDFVLTNCEQINDVHLLQFEASDCPAIWTQAVIKANFFMELFPTQSNVVQLNYQHKETDIQFGRMTLQTPSLLFEYKN